MSQLNWTVLDDFGRKYDVGLYHGDASGHLMVYCNTDVLIIDFNVLKDKKYSFYLGEELCELNVNKEKGRFSYGLIKNNIVNTPLNRRRKEIEKKTTIKTMGIALLLTVVCLCTYFMLIRLG